jgi:hypothetical protein
MSDPEFKHTPEQARALWYAALESGEYKQTRGSLRYNDRFCCLGVACDVYNKAEGLGGWRDQAPGERVIFEDGKGRRSRGVLPFAVQRWLGFYSDAAPRVGLRDATTLNDSLNWSFKRIAAHMRRVFREPKT